jgi:hypothetical protein
MTGSYGPWLADQALATDQLDVFSNWVEGPKRPAGWRQRVLETMAPVNLGGKPEVR